MKYHFEDLGYHSVRYNDENFISYQKKQRSWFSSWKHNNVDNNTIYRLLFYDGRINDDIANEYFNLSKQKTIKYNKLVAYSQDGGHLFFSFLLGNEWLFADSESTEFIKQIRKLKLKKINGNQTKNWR